MHLRQFQLGFSTCTLWECGIAGDVSECLPKHTRMPLALQLYVHIGMESCVPFGFMLCEYFSFRVVPYVSCRRKAANVEFLGTELKACHFADRRVDEMSKADAQG